MLSALVLYACVLLAYVPGLVFALNRRRFLRHPITACTFLGLFAFNAAGSILVIDSQIIGRDDYFRPEYLVMLVVQALVFYAIAFPYVALSRRSEIEYRVDPPVDRLLLVVVLGVVAAILGLFLLRVGVPPLLRILKPNMALQDRLRIRTEAVYGQSGFWLFHLGFNSLPLLAAAIVLAIRTASPQFLPRGRWIVLGCLAVNALPGGKGSVLDFVVSLTLVMFLLHGWSRPRQFPVLATRFRASARRRFSFRKIAVYVTLALAAVLLMYRVYLGAFWFSNVNVVGQIIYRIFGVYSESMASAVVFVEQNGLLDGRSLPTVRGLLGHDRLVLEGIMHRFMFGTPGAVTLSGPTVGYVNFGWPGFAAFAAASFLCMVLVEVCLKRLPKNVLSTTLIAFYAVLATKLAQVSLFATFVSLTYVALVVFLFAARIAIETWVNIGRPLARSAVTRR